MRRLASVLNTAAWLINPNKRFDHISDALISLHWLRDPERMEYKIAELTYKVPHGTAPRYLGPLTRVSDVPGRRALRSAITNRLVVLQCLANSKGPFVATQLNSTRRRVELRRYKRALKRVGSRAFPVAASQICTAL